MQETIPSFSEAVEDKQFSFENLRDSVIDELGQVYDWPEKPLRILKNATLHEVELVRLTDPKNTLYCQSDPCDAFYYLHKGEGYSQIVSSEGQRRILELYDPGAFLGFEDMLGFNKKSSEERSHEAIIGVSNTDICREQTNQIELLRISRSVFEGLVEEPKVCKSLLEIMADRIDFSQNIASKRSSQKLGLNACVAYYLLDRAHKTANENGVFQLPRGDIISDYLGASRENCLRAILDMSEQGIIRKQPYQKHAVILDEHRLAEIAGEEVIPKKALDFCELRA